MPETALLVIDMLNPYDHEDADKLAESVREVLPQIVDLRDRAHASDEVLLVYVNDNYEQWSETRDDLVRTALTLSLPLRYSMTSTSWPRPETSWKPASGPSVSPEPRSTRKLNSP